MSDEAPTETLAEVAARGAQIRAEVLGDDYVAASAERRSAFATPLFEYSLHAGWGTMWDRGALSRPERSLVIVTAMLATGHGPEATVHIRGAINNGVSVEQLQEVVLSVAFFCGIAAGVEAAATVQAALRDLGIDVDG